MRPCDSSLDLTRADCPARFVCPVVKKLDNAVLSPSSFLRATRTTVLPGSASASSLSAKEAAAVADQASPTSGADTDDDDQMSLDDVEQRGEERERWVLRLEDLVWRGQGST